MDGYHADFRDVVPADQFFYADAHTPSYKHPQPGYHAYQDFPKGCGDGISAYHPGGGAASPSRPVFHTVGQLTLASSPSKHSPSPPPSPAAPPSAASSPTAAAVINAQQEQIRGLSQENAELHERIAHLEAQLLAAQAAAAAAQGTQPPTSQAVDEEELQELRAELASRQREVGGLHQALDQQSAQLKAAVAELEQQREREAALLDELAAWRDAASKAEKEQSGLLRKLEAVTTHGGLLDTSLSALKKQNEELSTALAQADVQQRMLREEAEAARREADMLHSRVQQSEEAQQQLGSAMLMAQEEAASLRGRCQALERAATATAAAREAAASPAFGRSASQTSGLGTGAHPQQSTSNAEVVGLRQAAEGSRFHSASRRSSGAGERQPPSRPQTAAPALVSSNSQRQQQEAAGYPPEADVYSSARHMAGSYASRPGWEDWSSVGPGPSAAWAPSPSYARSSMPQPYQQQQRGGGAGMHMSRYAEHSTSDQHSSYMPQPTYMLQQAGRCMPGAPASEAGGQADGEGSALYSAPSSHQQPYSYHQQHQQQGGPSSTPNGRKEDIPRQLSGLSLQSSPAETSPFGTEDTVQAMLARTQALEARLTALTAEKNALAAEHARMPTTTAGRTLQERKRRAEVEQRQEEIQKEISSIRLQLKRLGAK